MFSNLRTLRHRITATVVASVAWGALLLNSLSATATTTSAIRLPSETFQQAVERNRSALERDELRYAREAVATPSANSTESSAFPAPLSAMTAADTLIQLKRQLIPEWQNLEQVQNGFLKIRDDRILTLPETPETSQTIPWSYAVDGCHARAAVAADHLETLGLRRPAKVFIFGALGMQSAQSGYVSWWYHVAPIVSHQGTAYVLDPAVEKNQPLPLTEWMQRFTRDSSQVTVSICNPYAYNPWSPCYVSGPEAEARARADALNFVRLAP